MDDFKIGDRVKIINGHKWPTLPEATVILGRGRPFHAKSGTTYAYTVRFDAPTHDNSPDGPYIVTEVFDRDIVLVDADRG